MAEAAERIVGRRLKREEGEAAVVVWLNRKRKEIGVVALAQILGVDAPNLAKVILRERKAPAATAIAHTPRWRSRVAGARLARRSFRAGLRSEPARRRCARAPAPDHARRYGSSRDRGSGWNGRVAYPEPLLRFRCMHFAPRYTTAEHAHANDRHRPSGRLYAVLGCIGGRWAGPDPACRSCSVSPMGTRMRSRRTRVPAGISIELRRISPWSCWKAASRPRWLRVFTCGATS
jgi:hypothetical protein